MHKNKLIVESFNLSNLVKVSNKQGYEIPNGCMLIEGVMGRVDSMNRNNRFYKRGDYAQRLVEFNERIQNENGILGEMEHPKSMNINLNNVSHKILGVRVDEAGFVRGEVLLLNTSKGRDAQAIVESGSPLPISSRATGRVLEDKSVQLESFATFDLVGTAGFAEASMYAVTESLQDENGQHVCESFIFDLDNSGNVVLENKADNDQKIDETKINEIVEKLVEAKLTEKGYVHESKIDKILEAKIEALREGSNESDFTLESIDERFATVYAPMIESWITNVYSPKVAETFQKWTINEFAPMIESWVVNEFAPVVESWTVNEFAPMVESWVVNEFAPVVESWTVNEFAPMVETWVTNEFAPVVESWVTSECLPSHGFVNEGVALTQAGEPITKEFTTGNFEKETEIFRSKIIDKVDALINKANSHVDDESVDKKPEGGEVEIVDESVFENAPSWVKFMPQDKKVIWQNLTEANKAEVTKRASIRVLSTKTQIDEFWENHVDMNAIIENKISVDGYKRQINESLDQDQPINPRMLVARQAQNMRK